MLFPSNVSQNATVPLKLFANVVVRGPKAVWSVVIWQVYTSAELCLSAGGFGYFGVQVGSLAENLLELTPC